MTQIIPSAPSRGRLLRDPLLVGTLGVAGAIALHLRDPHEATWVLCPFKFLTGYPCPGCGGLRAINLLGNGEFVAAVSSNLLAVALVPIVAVAWLLWFWRRARGDADARMISLSNSVLAIGVVAAVVFGVLRVTPWGSWLAP